MIRAFLFLAVLAAPVGAETARVLSGEHGDFTRLVIELPTGSDWTVGRTADGYAFAATSGPQPGYDLDTVWQRIPRDRLKALAVDPETGALTLGLGCDCHVFPFEYGAGIVVLDIKDGPAPPGSAFEAAFGLAAAAPASAAETLGYDWLNVRPTSPSRRAASLPLPLDTGSVSLEPLRDELLEQIAKGAADGLVDMALPGTPERKAAADNGILPWSNIRIGENPGVVVTRPGALVPEVGTSVSCAPAEEFDLAAWGQGRLPHELLAEARGGLFGEFDVADEAEVLRSTRQLLFLGFGAEAEQVLDFLGPDATAEGLSNYRAMAHLVEGDPDPDAPFAQMLNCDGPAALWAALAHERLPPGPSVNRDAILQGFQSLPPHLRQHLGPGLAEKFLGVDDAEAARIIRDAIERAPDADPGSLALLDAKAELHDGDTEAARAHAEVAVTLDGDSAESLVALVETHARSQTPLDPKVADALLGLKNETDASAIGPAVGRATVLALALSGQIEAAFAHETATEVLADLWPIVLARAEDDSFLLHAVLPMTDSAPTVAPETAEAIAVRLLGLGFPDAAANWIGPIQPTDPPDLRLLAAKAELARGDARAAVSLLSGLEEAEAAALRARALLQLGDLPAASLALSESGDADAALRAELWDGNWASLDPAAPEAWRRVAEQAQPVTAADDAGALGRGDQSVAASLASREAIDALLSSVPSPTLE